MDKNKKLAMILPVLICVAVLIWMPHLKPVFPERPDQKKGLVQLELSEEEIEKLVLLGHREKEQVKSSFEGWGRNPFVLKEEPVEVSTEAIQEQVKTEPMAADLILNGIFWDESKPSVLINDVLLGIGDSVDQYTVIQITQNTAVVQKGNVVSELIFDSQ